MLASSTSVLSDAFHPHSGRIFTEVALPGELNVQLEIEGLCQDKSIKGKAAREMVSQALAQDLIDFTVGLIETSSGNNARALSRICAELDIPCTIIVDPNVSASNVAVKESFGARVIRVEEPDPGGGYQASRIKRLKEELARTQKLYWPNQYDNPANAAAHTKTTGPEILTAVPQVARIYCATGTGGTAAGLGHFLRRPMRKRESWLATSWGP